MDNSVCTPFIALLLSLIIVYLRRWEDVDPHQFLLIIFLYLCPLSLYAGAGTFGIWQHFLLKRREEKLLSEFLTLWLRLPVVVLICWQAPSASCAESRCLARPLNTSKQLQEVLCSWSLEKDPDIFRCARTQLTIQSYARSLLMHRNVIVDDATNPNVILSYQASAMVSASGRSIPMGIQYPCRWGERSLASLCLT